MIFANQSQIYNYIGEYLRDARKSKHMRQKDVAALVGLTRTSIVNMESGKQRIPLHIMYKLCAALDVEAWDLLPAVKDVCVKL